MKDLQIQQSYTNRDSLSVELYLNELSKSTPLNPKEEVVLAEKIRQGDRAALDRLVKANLRFVVSVAKQYLHKGLPLADLISEGNLGLIEAAKKFDETRGFKFISYAVWWIRQRIMAAITDQGRTIRLPHNQTDTLRHLLETRGMAEQQLERMPTPEELAGLMGVPLYKVADALHYTTKVLSYDIPLESNEDHVLLDLLASNEDRADAIVLAESEREELYLQLAKLSWRERTIIEHSFGLDGLDPLMAVDIARLIGYSPERVRQLRNEAIAKLQLQFGVGV